MAGLQFLEPDPNRSVNIPFSTEGFELGTNSVINWKFGRSDAIYDGGLSFSGVDIHATCFVPSALSSGSSISAGTFKKFAELQTITVSSNRGVYPVRRLGESFVAEYVKGTRTIAGTIIFSVLEKDVFSNLYQVDKRDTRNAQIPFVDMLPPFTIGLHAINESGKDASMFLTDVTLTNFGMTISVDDLFIESTYNYVAKWATPFMPGSLVKNLSILAQALAQEGNFSKASDLLIDGASRQRIVTISDGTN